MTDVWVVNSSPLIVLGKAGALALLPDLVPRLIVPAAVELEIQKGPPDDPAGHWLAGPGASLVGADGPLPASILNRKLGAGESAVLAHALIDPGCEVIIDDLAARRAAAELGIPFRGTLGVILLARKRNLITSAATLFDLVEEAGLYIAPGLRTNALALVGE